MLISLDIKNAALIEHLSLDIEEGMTVLTGETGAGKSVIIDSVNMILGARADKTLVRHGEKKAIFQALFTSDDTAILEELGIPAEDGQIIITRELSSDGKSICRVNGVISVQNTVREITDKLINIHGQHDSQALLNPSMHIDFLDSYAKNENLLEEYSVLYNEKKSIESELESLRMDEAEKMRKIDLLSYQAEEIENAHLRPGEKVELTDSRKLIQNAEKISSALNGSYEYLYNGENSAYDSISTASGLLAKISDIDSSFEDIYNRISDIKYAIDDLAHEIYDKASETEYDEQTLNEIESRLDLINKLEKKYGGSEEAVISYYETITDELSKISDTEAENKRLTMLLEENTKKITAISEKLNKSRKEAGKKLGSEIENELSDLDMPNAKFTVAVTTLPDFSKKGTDLVEFLISPNPGEPQKPLNKIASGGELSRVMLAIKSILADTDNVDTLIFDEIDTGVSGSAAKKIAKKLSALSSKKQVICVSHQPQLAAAADNHFKIKKSQIAERTLTTAEMLDDDARIIEIARIIDGDNITDASLNHAKEMIAQYKL